MSPITAVRAALARLLGEALDIDYLDYLPANPQAGQVYIVPRPPYLDFVSSPATWCRPVVALDAAITMSTADWPNALATLDDQIARVGAAVKADPDLGGRCSPLQVYEVSPPFLLATSGTQSLLAVAVSFRPTQVKDLHT
jgi:hypothetical protein